MSGIFNKDDVSKMIFAIELLPEEKSFAAYQCASFFETSVKFFIAINKWAIRLAEADEDGLDRERYDDLSAIMQEMNLF